MEAGALNPAAEAMLKAMPFFGALGVDLVEMGAGRVVLEAPLSPPLEAPPGAFAASSVGVIGDMAAISSVMTQLPAGQAIATVDFTVKMIAQTIGERLRAEGRVLSVGGTLCVAQAEVSVINGAEATQCGVVLATGRRFSIGGA